MDKPEIETEPKSEVEPEVITLREAVVRNVAEAFLTRPEDEETARSIAIESLQEMSPLSLLNEISDVLKMYGIMFRPNHVDKEDGN